MGLRSEQHQEYLGSCLQLTVLMSTYHIYLRLSQLLPIYKSFITFPSLQLTLSFKSSPSQVSQIMFDSLTHRYQEQLHQFVQNMSINIAVVR